MKEQYKTLLDATYELEGLLTLALRNENPDENLEKLVLEKAGRLSELLKNIGGIQEAYETQHGSVVEKPVEETVEAQEEEPLEEPVEVLVKEPEAEHIEMQAEEPVKEPLEEEAVKEAVPEKEAFESYYIIEDDEEERSERRILRRHHRNERSKKKPVFSLNDRFLFIRELFDGDASKFNMVTDRLGDFDDYDSAQDYLIREYNITPERETDERFLAIVEAFYK